MSSSSSSSSSSATSSARSVSPTPSASFPISSNYIGIRPQNPTRRPSLSKGPHRIASPPLPTDPAPDYDSIGHPNIILPNAPPAITEDTSPPWYTWGDSTQAAPPLISAIFTQDEAGLQRLIGQDPNIVNRKDGEGRTPLYCATAAYKRDIGIVRLLLEAGADVNEWSAEFLGPTDPRKRGGVKSLWPSKKSGKTVRTPLMAACQRNHLPIARLLLAPPYGADPKLVAPDGQHALRLASSAGAREIVALLPSFRAGGWKRLKHRSRPHIEVIKSVGRHMYKVGRVIFWKIPVFFLWSIPKHLTIFFWRVAKATGCKLWAAVKSLPGKTYRFAARLPGAIKRGIKRAPGAVKRFFVGLWWFLSVSIPELTVDTAKVLWYLFWKIVKWVWNVITVRLPKASVIVFNALITGIKKMAGYAVDVVSTVASLLHTCVSFILRQCTWENVVQGIKTTLGFFFIDVPVTVWKVMRLIYNLCFIVVEELFGCLGWFVWFVWECLMLCALWFPMAVGKILLSCGKILEGVWKELRVLVNPKAEV